MAEPVRVVVVGAGWRSQLFFRLAAVLPDLEIAGALVRRPESGDELRRRWGITAYLSLDDALAAVRPGFVITSVPWAVTPEMVRSCVEQGYRVLAETPPAPDGEGLRRLWRAVGHTGLVQVAEQYVRYPGHAARLAIVQEGVIGRPTGVQVSSTHGYHAVSLIRHFLGTGFAPVTVRANAFDTPLVDPLTRDGWTGDTAEHDKTTTIATLDFGGAVGLYDFTTNQWHNQLRMRRIVVRGSIGEIVDDAVVRLAGAQTIVRSAFVRRQTGYDLDLDGYDTDHITFDGRVVYRNPFRGLRLSDDEIAVASLLTATAAWSRGDGPAPYPLAEASQDHLVALAIEESARTGTAITTTREPWTAD